jgi:serine/threonine-protein kinase HipA
MIERLDVFLWQKKIGSLIASKKGYHNRICFYFNPDYLNGGYDFAPLCASLSGVAARRGLPIYPEENKIFNGLPSFISDSMPDHWGNIIFAEWAKARHIRMRDLTPLDRLAYIGRRGMGALEFLPPSSPEMEMPFKVEVAELSRLAQMALNEAKNFHAVMSPGLVIESLFKVGTSAGGRRPKAVINLNRQTGECYSGQVPAPLDGFVPMIIKFDEHGEIPTTKIEYSYYLMALEAGLDMMPCSLFEAGDETHFLTERFDRRGEEKIHVQTLAAMNPLSTSYEELFDTAVRIGIVASELKQLFLQMVMNVVGGNVDDHNKNFSFLMGKDGVWHVAPAYDYTFSVDTSGPFYVNRHSMTVNGKCEDITKEDLLAVATAYSIPKPESLIGMGVEIAGKYRRFAQEARVPERWIQKIESELSERLLLFK